MGITKTVQLSPDGLPTTTCDFYYLHKQEICSIKVMMIPLFTRSVLRADKM